MLVDGKVMIELEEGERDALHDALDILSPDNPDASEALEVLTQNVLDATIEPGALEMSFSSEEVELAIAALEVVQPDDFEVQEMVSDMEERFREIYAEFEDMSPGM